MFPKTFLVMFVFAAIAHEIMKPFELYNSFMFIAVERVVVSDGIERSPFLFDLLNCLQRMAAL
jgi:hypothetical protein